MAPVTFTQLRAAALCATGIILGTLFVPSDAIADTARSCPSQLQWLGDNLPDRSQIQLLAAAGRTIPVDHAAVYREMELAVFRCAGEDSLITLRPIDSNARTQAAHLTIAVPIADSNHLKKYVKTQQFLELANTALDDLPGLGNGQDGSDPIGAIESAAQDLRMAATSKGSHRIIVLIFNGWIQSAEFPDGFKWGQHLDLFTDRVLKRLNETGEMPDLSGTDVVIAGLTPGARPMRMTDGDIQGLRVMWQRIIASSKGHLVFCDAVFPGVSQ